MGPILEFVVLEGVMERLFLWSLRRHFTEDMKLEQLRMYQMLLTQAQQPLLHHKPLLRPLMTLLASCGGAGAGTIRYVTSVDSTPRLTALTFFRRRRLRRGRAGPPVEPAVRGSGEGPLSVGIVLPHQRRSGRRQLPALLLAHPVHAQVLEHMHA